MKVFILYISLVLTCLHLTNATIEDRSRRVGSIHHRVTAVPSAGGSVSKALENRPVPAIDRTISSQHRYRRVASHVTSDEYGRLIEVRTLPTPYPKHHSLQPIPEPLGGFLPEEDLSTTAPYTENHHSWKKSTVLFN